ncbi:MAG: hypothetical protein QOG85_564, partial [Gaiellaceae bacterium]|nr:hypothetical protein [Gaiellaceae bacterium]
KSCFPREGCYIVSGWSVRDSGIAAGLTGILVVLILGFRRLSPEVAVAIAIYVLGMGFTVTAYGTLSYGAFLGFAGAALILLAVAPRLGSVSVSALRLVPAAACFAFAGLAVAIFSGKLPGDLATYNPWLLRLVETAAIVVALRLLGGWLTRQRGDELLLLALALLAFVGLALGELQDPLFVNWEGYFFNWEGYVFLGLAAFLVLCGLVERNGGIPEEIWRIDRISTGEN